MKKELKMVLMPRYDGKYLEPKYQTFGSAGIDLYVNILDNFIEMGVGEVKIIGTGVKVQIPEGHVGLLTLRSSIGARGFVIPNGVGVIDSDYRGEVKITLCRIKRDDCSDNTLILNGDRIAQLVVIPFEQCSLKVVKSLDETERGEGGFGSTNK